MIKNNSLLKLYITLFTSLSMVLVCLSYKAEAAMYWAPVKHGGHAHHGVAKAFELVSGKLATASLIDPLLKEHVLDVNKQVVTVKPTGFGNYHTLVATRKINTSTESAVRYIYMYGRPSGVSPSELTAKQKSKLEIEPKPLAREHRRYYSGNEAVFFVRFNGRPVAYQDVLLTTANGSAATIRTDEKGLLEVNLPEDFSDIKAGQKENQPANFILSTKINVEGHDYVSTFSSAYHVNPNHWQSTKWGAMTVLFGMFIGGLFTLRKREGS